MARRRGFSDVTLCYLIPKACVVQVTFFFSNDERQREEKKLFWGFWFSDFCFAFHGWSTWWSDGE